MDGTQSAIFCTKREKQKEDHSSYVIMLKDKEVCKINRRTGKVLICDDRLMPFDIYLEEGEDADTQNNVIVFNWWCAHRILSLDREYAKAILNACNIKQATTDKDRADISLSYQCLSLKDFYWVKKENATETWESINLFDHSLSNAVIDIALLGKNLTVSNRHLLTSDLATDGLFPKAWVRKDGRFYLYKGDKNNSVEKEVNASKLLRRLGFCVIDYQASFYDEEKVSVSECFTSKNIGYVTAGDMFQNYDLNINCEEYDFMNLCDYLVGNSDRHQDNWGYLFNDKREMIGFAPIFDFNHAFEASEDFMCLPEQLFGRNIRMIDFAKGVVSKYGLELELLPETDAYTSFVNRRIRLLR